MHSFIFQIQNECVPGSLLNVEEEAMKKPDKILALMGFAPVGETGKQKKDTY